MSAMPNLIPVGVGQRHIHPNLSCPLNLKVEECIRFFPYLHHFGLGKEQTDDQFNITIKVRGNPRDMELFHKKTVQAGAARTSLGSTVDFFSPSLTDSPVDFNSHEEPGLGFSLRFRLSLPAGSYVGIHYGSTAFFCISFLLRKSSPPLLPKGISPSRRSHQSVKPCSADWILTRCSFSVLRICFPSRDPFFYSVSTEGDQKMYPESFITCF